MWDAERLERTGARELAGVKYFGWLIGAFTICVRLAHQYWV